MSGPSMAAGPMDDGFGTTCNTVTWILTSISIIAVTLRLIARNLKKDFGFDDIVIVWSVIIDITLASLMSKAISEGMGAHVQTLTQEQGVQATKWIVIANSVAIHGFSWPKLAIVPLLRKMLLPGKIAKILLYSSVGLLGLCVIVLNYMLVGICNPPQKQWLKNLPGSCWNPKYLTDFAIFSGALSATLDLSYAIYPCYKIYHLQMSMQRRLGYSSIMSLGVVAFGFTIYKCTKLPALNMSQDPTYLSAQLLLWTLIESNVVVLAACIPTLSPLVRALHGRTKQSFSGGKSGGSPFPSWNPLKNVSRNSKHHRLTEDEERMNPQRSDIELGGYGKNGVNVQSAGAQDLVNALNSAPPGRRRDLESSPPSDDDLDLGVNPLGEQSHAWAGKPNSSRGPVPNTRPHQMRDPSGIVRNVEVSVSTEPAAHR